MSKNHEVIGTGKTHIVFVHYFGGDAGSWRWLAKKLSKKYTCILLNLPGFNDTIIEEEPSIAYYAQYINAQIASLNLKSYVLCGHSMGGKLALYAALINKYNKPEGIILIAPSPPTVEHMPKKEKERMLNHPNKDEAATTVENATRKTLKKSKLEYAVKSQLRIQSKAWQWWLETGMNHDISKRIYTLDIPTVVICSEDDPVISMQAIHNDVMPYLSKGSLITLSGIGHLIPLEATQKLAKQIHNICKTL